MHFYLKDEQESEGFCAFVHPPNPQKNPTRLGPGLQMHRVSDLCGSRAEAGSARRGTRPGCLPAPARRPAPASPAPWRPPARLSTPDPGAPLRRGGPGDSCWGGSDSVSMHGARPDAGRPPPAPGAAIKGAAAGAFPRPRPRHGPTPLPVAAAAAVTGGLHRAPRARSRLQGRPRAQGPATFRRDPDERAEPPAGPRAAAAAAAGPAGQAQVSGGQASGGTPARRALTRVGGQPAGLHGRPRFLAQALDGPALPDVAAPPACRPGEHSAPLTLGTVGPPSRPGP